MDYAISFAKRFIVLPFNSPKQRKKEVIIPPSELSTLGMDNMLRILSFVDGESMYELSCVNKEYGF